MSRKRTAGTFERVDPSNPNVIEVVYHEEQDEQQQHSLPPMSHEPQQQIGGREVDDVLFGGVVPSYSSNTHGQSNRRNDEWAQGSNLRGNRGDPVMPSTSFLRDAYNGTPFNLFNFDAMKRHIQRQVEWMTTDVATLIGGIQMHTNRPMSELLLNGSFFNAGAKDLHELHSDGGLGSHIIGPMLAQLINSILSGHLVQSIRSPDDDDDEFIQRLDADLLDAADEEYEFDEMGDEEWEPLVSVGKSGRDMWLVFKEDETDLRPVKEILRAHWNQKNPQDQVADFATAAQQKQVEIVKKAVQDGVASSSKLASNVRQLKDFPRAPQRGGGIQVFGGRGQRLNASIASHIESNGVSHQSAIRVIQKMRDSMQQIGLFGDRGPQDNRLPQDRIMEQVQAILSQDAQAVATQRWLWNSLPENSGITAVAPDVKFAIEEAFENIRGIPGKEHFKLIHLIRSPRVRSKFAAYVASLMNVVPGHIAYSNSVSGRGRTSYKVSAGVQLRRQNAKLGRAGLLWFESVDYARDPNVSEAQQKISASVSKLDEAQQILEAKILEILAAKAEIWAVFTEADKGIAWALRHYHKELSKEHNKWIKESKLEQEHRQRRENNAEIAAGARKDLAKSRMVQFERLIEWIINDRSANVPGFRVEGLRRALWPHAWTWFDLFGINNAEWNIIAPPGNRPDPAHFQFLVPPVDNLAAGAEMLTPFEIKEIVSPMLEPRDYVKLNVALELAKTETMKAFRDASIWGNRGIWATTHSPKLRRVLDLMSEVQTSDKVVDTLTKGHLEATRLLGGMSEDDMVILVKNTNTGRRHKVRRLAEGSSYAEAEEGYFPQPMILLDNYEIMTMGVQPYRARGTFN
jgi:hypothetical protein